jgi:hypothetical protein
MYQGRLGEMEGKSDKFVQKFNELLDFTDHADRVFQTGGFHQKRILMKLCFEGFVVRNQKLTPFGRQSLMSLWTSKYPRSNLLNPQGGQKTLQTLRFKLENLAVFFERSSNIL